jgi:hypothetical protein
MGWIISEQISRRNLTQDQMIYYRGKQYEMEKRTQGTNNQYVQKSEKPQNAVFQNTREPESEKVHFALFQKSEIQRTSERDGKQYGVSADTIKRDAKVAKVIDKIGETSPVAPRCRFITKIINVFGSISAVILSEVCLPAFHQTSVLQSNNRVIF